MFALSKFNPFPRKGMEKMFQEIPKVWIEFEFKNNFLGLTKHVPPIMVQLASGAMPILIKKSFTSSETRERIKVYIRYLFKAGILIPCQSVCNTTFHSAPLSLILSAVKTLYNYKT